MAGELKLMRDFFFDKMNGDATFRARLGGDDIAFRVGQPTVPEGTTFPVVNVRNISRYSRGVLRILNQGSIVWVQEIFLVVAIANIARYPTEEAKLMEGLFESHGSLVVTGGTIHHCYLDAPYDAAYSKDGIDYREAGGFWIIAAKAD